MNIKRPQIIIDTLNRIDDKIAASNDEATKNYLEQKKTFINHMWNGYYNVMTNVISGQLNQTHLDAVNGLIQSMIDVIPLIPPKSHCYERGFMDHNNSFSSTLNEITAASDMSKALNDSNVKKMRASGFTDDEIRDFGFDIPIVKTEGTKESDKQN